LTKDLSSTVLENRLREFFDLRDILDYRIMFFDAACKQYGTQWKDHFEPEYRDFLNDVLDRETGILPQSPDTVFFQEQEGNLYALYLTKGRKAMRECVLKVKP
jgi:hypothetical protein